MESKHWTLSPVNGTMHSVRMRKQHEVPKFGSEVVAPARCTRARIFSCVGKCAGAAIFGLAGGILVAALMAAGAAEQKTTTHDQRKIDRARYLVKIAGCNDCHTAGYGMAEGKVAESQWLMGDKLGWRGAWGTTYAVNLRLTMNSLTEEQWVVMARNSSCGAVCPYQSGRSGCQVVDAPSASLGVRKCGKL